MPPHYLEHHRPLVTGSSRVQTIERIRYTADRRVKPECHCGRFQVVIDRFRYADHGKALFVKLERGRQRTVSAHHDQAVYAKLCECFPGALDYLFWDHRFFAAADFSNKVSLVRGAEDRAAELHDSGGRGPVEDCILAWRK